MTIELLAPHKQEALIQRELSLDLLIQLMTEAEFKEIQPPLDRFRALAYARYTADGSPKTIITAKEELDRTTAYYVVAQHPNLPLYLPLTHNLYPDRLRSQFQEYPTIAGFFRIEHGSTSNDNHPIEAMKLIQWKGWPQDTTIGYCSEFTPNPLLSKHARCQVLHQLFIEASHHAQNLGFANELFVILADHVLEFVHDSRIDTQPVPGSELNWENPTAREIFTTWPRYWGEPDSDNPPKLYKFVPFQ